MSVADQLVGVSSEVLADERIQAAIKSIEAGESTADAAPIVTATPPDLSKYGITLRTSGLMTQTMLVRVVGALRKHALVREGADTISFQIPDEYQPFLWTFVLGAPKLLVYKALDALDADGLPAAMVMIHDWFDSLNVPATALTDILQAMANSFETAMKAMKFVPSEGADEKKAPTGS